MPDIQFAYDYANYRSTTTTAPTSAHPFVPEAFFLFLHFCFFGRKEVVGSRKKEEEKKKKPFAAAVVVVVAL